ncbi:MAG: SDR family NAD(P)-dependent oxidoreductase [Candidatus Rokuibacteriota bacterium]
MDVLRDRVAVVTGGGSGIGRALAEAFAREGAHLVVADLEEPAAAVVADGIRRRGGQAIAVRTDVSDQRQVQELAEGAFSHFGAVHILCNNAGVAFHGTLQDATHKDWQWVLGVNLWGVIHGLEAFLPRMIAERQPGHIVNTASMAGLIASQGLGIYNASKYAVVGISETLVKDLRPHGIGVSVLCPMGVSTRIRQSARNRPLHLRNDQERASPEVELIGKYLEPDTVAAMTVAAIRANRLYVITHDESLEPLRRRFQRLEGAILDRPR